MEGILETVISGLSQISIHVLVPKVNVEKIQGFAHMLVDYEDILEERVIGRRAFPWEANS